MQLIKKRIRALPDRREAFELLKVFETLFTTQCLGSAGLAINAAAAVTVKAGSAFSALVANTHVYKAAATVMTALPALPLVLTLQYQMWTFTIDGAGNLYTLPGAPSLTLAGVQIPIVPESPVQAVIGSLVLYNGTASTFTPNTTALDTALLISAYNNTVGPFFPIPPL